MKILHSRSPREYCGRTYTPIIDTTDLHAQGIPTPAELWSIVLLATKDEHKRAVIDAFTRAFTSDSLGQLARHMLGYTAHMGEWCPIPVQAILPPELLFSAMQMNQIYPNQLPPSQPPLIQYALAPRANRFLQLLFGSAEYLYFTTEGIRDLERELYAIT